MRIPPITLALAVLSGTALAQVPAPSPGKRSALAGVIRDSMSRPLPMATVLVDGKDLSTVTDESGRFHLAGITSGTNDFTVLRIGYRSVSFTTTLAPDSTLVIAIVLRRISTLEEVEVKAASISPRLERQGYYERRNRAIGSFVTPEKVDSLQHVASPSQLLRDVRGIEVRCLKLGCVVMTTRSHGCLNLFIDGVFHRDQIDDVLGTTAVFAIEVYENPNIVPLEFQGGLGRRGGAALNPKAGCGALVVWTRSRAIK
ncbi:MAG: carboxypeptidase-like regulatory domain-containing protein [Gemmatimonadaceae bacterium]